MIACATLWGKVKVSDAFYYLPVEQQEAVLAHECGHLRLRHCWKRLWWLLTLRAFLNYDGFLGMCEQHEFEADAFAVKMGKGKALRAFLSRYPLDEKHEGYPTMRERLERINV